MNRLISIAVAIILLTFSAHSQNLSELFNQGKTAIKCLEEQVAAYGLLLADIGSGYKSSGAGLGNISSETGLEEGLHFGYYASLASVSPVVAGYSRVGAIDGYATAIVQAVSSLWSLPNMTSSDENYFASVSVGLVRDCSQAMDELSGILLSGDFLMTDGERISRIDELYGAMKERWSFLESFLSSAQWLSVARAGEQCDIQMSEINNGLR